jgi:predicted O-linked N-acetylglucosamine transferase (SPINDLY family)
MFNWKKKKVQGPGSEGQSSAQAAKAQGDEHLKGGRLEAAEANYRLALEEDPGLGSALVNLGFVLQQMNRLEEARTVLERASEVAPDDADGHYLLAGVLQSAGENAAAIGHLEQALDLREEFDLAYRDLIVLLFGQGQIAQATQWCERGLLACPGSAELHFYRSNLFKQAGDREAAIASCQKALELNAALLGARLSLSGLLLESGRLEEALASYRVEIEWNPNHAGPHHQAGVVLFQMARFEEAIPLFRRAIELSPDLAASYYCLAGAYSMTDHVAEDRLLLAQKMCEEAIERAPEIAEFHYGLGKVFQQRAMLEEALSSYEKAIVLDSDHVGARWARVMICAPAFSGETGASNLNRSDFASALKEFSAWFEDSNADGQKFVGGLQPFFLTYQEENNLPLLKQYGQVCSRAMQRWFDKQQFRVDPLPPGPRIRVGIVSANIRMHSVWMALIKGWIEHLDLERFELVVFSLAGSADAVTAFARARSDTFVAGPKSLHQWVESILKQNPAILIYPAVGLDEVTTQLASLRLAPVQMNAWGHPDTSGLPTIDYYLSAECFEPENAQANYSETLVRLPNLGNPYEQLSVSSVEPDYIELGLDPERPMLICPGTPFKYQPEHDHVFVEIAQRAPQCQFLFFRPVASALADQFRGRLHRAFAAAHLDFEDFCRFLPWQTFNQYHGLLKRADVFLDTIGFSGYNSAIQAMECGLPVVTREGRYLRGRLASGILRRVGLIELIAQGKSAYVDLAVRLVEDDRFRQQIRQTIVERRSVLFGDLTPIAPFEELLASAVRSGVAREGPLR